MRTALITAALLFTYGFTVMLLDGPLKSFVPRCESTNFGFCVKTMRSGGAAIERAAEE